MSDSYAIIGKLKLSKVDGAKTLQIGLYQGMPFAVSMHYNEDDLYLIFLPDGQISEEYAKQHDLIGYADPETGKKKGGFFGKNRKVRSLSLMQGKIKSVGYVAEIQTLDFTGVNLQTLKEGTEITTVNGVPICTKFVSEATKAARTNNKGQKTAKKRDIIGLTEHKDTTHFYKVKNTIHAGDLITVTLKLDGTSVRSANCMVKKHLTWFEKLIDRFVPVEKFTREHITATRRVLLADSKNPYYGTDNMYREFGEKLRGNLLPGESVFGEIVGWQSESKPLFNRGGVIFKYGCQPGTRDHYVYAIKWTLPDGTAMQLPWEAVKQRCQELGIKHVPEIIPTFVFNGDIKVLDDIVDSFMEGADPIDPEHIREGIVIRIDRGNETFFRKAKGPAYYALEDKAKNEEGYVDIEEIQDQETVNE